MDKPYIYIKDSKLLFGADGKEAKAMTEVEEIIKIIQEVNPEINEHRANEIHCNNKKKPDEIKEPPDWKDIIFKAFQNGPLIWKPIDYVRLSNENTESVSSQEITDTGDNVAQRNKRIDTVSTKELTSRGWMQPLSSQKSDEKESNDTEFKSITEHDVKDDCHKSSSKSYIRDQTEKVCSGNTQGKVIERKIKGMRGSVDADVEVTASYVKERRRGKNPELTVNAHSAGRAQLSLWKENAAKTEYGAEFKTDFKSYRREPTEGGVTENIQEKVIEREVKGDVNTGVRGSVDFNVLGCKKNISAAAKADVCASYVKERRSGRNPETAVTAKSAGRAQLTFGERNPASAEYDAEFKRNFKVSRIDERSSGKKKVIKREVECGISSGVRGSSQLDISNLKQKLEAKVDASSDIKAEFEMSNTDFIDVSSSEERQIKVEEHEIMGGIKTRAKISSELNMFNHKKQMEAEAEASARAKASFVAADVNITKWSENKEGHAKLLHGSAEGNAAVKGKVSFEKHSIEMMATAEGKSVFQALDGKFDFDAKKGKDDGSIHISGITGKLADAKVEGGAKFEINDNVSDKNTRKSAESYGEFKLCGTQLRALSANVNRKKDYGTSLKTRTELLGAEANICNAAVIGEETGKVSIASAEMKGFQINAGNFNASGKDNRTVASAKARTGVALDVRNINATGIGQKGVKMEADASVGTSMFSMFNINLTGGPIKFNFSPGALNFGIPFLGSGGSGDSVGKGSRFENQGENDNRETGAEGRTSSKDETVKSNENLGECKSEENSSTTSNNMNDTCERDRISIPADDATADICEDIDNSNHNTNTGDMYDSDKRESPKQCDVKRINRLFGNNNRKCCISSNCITSGNAQCYDQASEVGDMNEFQGVNTHDCCYMSDDDVMMYTDHNGAEIAKHFSKEPLSGVDYSAFTNAIQGENVHKHLQDYVVSDENDVVIPAAKDDNHTIRQDAHTRKRAMSYRSTLESQPEDKIDRSKTIQYLTRKQKPGTNVTLNDDSDFNKFVASQVAKKIRQLEDKDKSKKDSAKNSKNASALSLRLDKECFKHTLIKQYTKLNGKSGGGVSGTQHDSRSKASYSNEHAPVNENYTQTKPQTKLESKKPFGANKNIHTIFTLGGTADRQIKYLKKNVACFDDR